MTSKAKRQSSALQQLLQSIQMLSCPSYSAAALLRVMSQVNGQVRRRQCLQTLLSDPVLISAVVFSGQSILLALLPLLERLLEQSSPDTPNLLRDEAQFMLLILSKYNQASAPLLAKDENCLDLFIRTLRNSTQQHPDIPSCQIYALEQVSPSWTRLTTRIKPTNCVSLQITKSFFSAVESEAVQQKLLSVMFDLLVENPSPLVAVTIGSVFKRVSGERGGSAISVVVLTSLKNHTQRL